MFDPHRATLRNRIDSGRCLGVAWLALGSAAMVEIAARSKPDGIVIDLQHGLWERRELEAAIGLVPPEIPVLVRTAENTPFAIGMALDAGAEGVIVPLVETAKQARKAVAAAKYPPDGIRSGGGVRPLGDFVSYVEGAGKIVTIVMIETEKGVRNAAAIAATEGVDMVFIGTGDLALSLGTFPAMHHDHSVACADVHRACKAAWTPCGVFTPSLEVAKMRRSQGYRMVVTANDMDVIGRGFNQASTGFAAAPTPAQEVSAAPAKRIEG
jgi:2-keto-3-deoxy-L-rhamnonate aldolase RhmA